LLGDTQVQAEDLAIKCQKEQKPLSGRCALEGQSVFQLAQGLQRPKIGGQALLLLL